jgi:transcriptional regulator with GAF, ATPase, and Fis domain
LILPFLFLAECGENEMTNWALGSLVEDTLIFPVNIQALDARISNLLKLRLMSQEQQRYSRNIEEAHQRAERSLKMIQETNRVAIKAENEQELLDNFCSIVCRYGGYAAVCIHYMRKEQEEENTLRCVASSGSQDISELESRIFQGNRNTACPIYLAIDTNTHQIVRQGADNPKFQPFLDHLRKAGLQTALCVPLGFGQRIYGETEFYSSSTNRFFRYRPCVWIRSFNQMAAEGRKIGFTCGILAGCP